MSLPSQPWPFCEEGAWDTALRTWRWRADAISVEQAKLLSELAPGWTWTVRENHEAGDFTFALTRWNGVEPVEVAPKRRRHRWSPK